MSKKLKTIDIKGKPYVQIKERIKYFRSTYPDLTLISQIVEHVNGEVLMRAEISDPTGRVLAVGHAFEKENSSLINKISYIENCETSAWGRALANFGIGIDENISSFDEMQNAMLGREAMEEKQKATEAELAETFQETMNNIQMATDEQVKEIKNLLFALQQPESAVLEKNNAKSFKEFTEKAAETLINKLKEKVG